MSYLTVISLTEAKLYLRVDDTLTEDDALITLAINTALKHLEDQTYHIAFARAKTYFCRNGCRRVHDYPINSVVSPASVESSVRNLHTDYNIDTEGDLVLNVGYEDPSNYPDSLKNVALEIIDLLYYANETDKTINDLSVMSKMIINEFRRFLV
jgi:hypothetical protein